MMFNEREQAEQDLRLKYLKVDVPQRVAEKVFEKAWEDGHSAGLYEVEMHYDEIATIANLAFEGGRKHELSRVEPEREPTPEDRCHGDGNGNVVHYCGRWPDGTVTTPTNRVIERP